MPAQSFLSICNLVECGKMISGNPDLNRSVITGTWRFLILSSLWAILSASLLGLSDQEAYYWTWSKALDWSYYEHPPIQAWLTRLTSLVFGDSPFSIRFVCFFWGRIVGFYFLFKWAEEKWDSKTAWFYLILIATSNIAIANSLIALPDAFFFPFFCALLWATGRNKIILSGLFLGLCGLTKWTSVFLVPGVIVSLYKNQKELKPFLWSVIRVGFISAFIQLPVIYWNSQHDWIAFKFHLSYRYPEFNGQLFSLIERLFQFGFSQILFTGIGAGIAVFTLASNKLLSWRLISVLKSDLTYWIVPGLAIVAASAIRGDLRFYWTAPSLIITLALIASISQNLRSSLFRALFRRIEISGYFSLALFTLILGFPVGEWVKPIVEVYRNHDIRFSLRGDLEGWKELTEYLNKNQTLPESQLRESTMLVATNLRTAAQITWASGKKHPFHTVVVKNAPNQFGIWSKTDPILNLKQNPLPNALFVGDNRYPVSIEMNSLCLHPLEWKTFDYKLMGHTVKIITYAICASPSV